MDTAITVGAIVAIVLLTIGTVVTLTMFLARRINIAENRALASFAASSLAFALAAMTVLLVRWDYSWPPGGIALAWFVQDHHGPPESWVPALIQREDGLPKAGTHLTHYNSGPNPDIGIMVSRNTERPDAFPVAHYEIERITLTSPYNLFIAILKQEAVYSIQVEFRVRYMDGEDALFRWDTWRYGWKFGPVAIDSGGGPAGELILLREAAAR